MADIISARVDEKTRRRIKELPHINWNEVIREAIADRLKREERREVDPADQRLIDKTGHERLRHISTY